MATAKAPLSVCRGRLPARLRIRSKAPTRAAAPSPKPAHPASTIHGDSMRNAASNMRIASRITRLAVSPSSMAR